MSPGNTTTTINCTFEAIRMDNILMFKYIGLDARLQSPVEVELWILLDINLQKSYYRYKYCGHTKLYKIT